MATVLASSHGVINDIALVRDSSVYVTGDGHAIVAVITEPIYTKSERDRLQREIVSVVGERYGTHDVYVTFDTDLYSAVTNLDSDDDARSIIETISERSC